MLRRFNLPVFQGSRAGNTDSHDRCDRGSRDLRGQTRRNQGSLCFCCVVKKQLIFLLSAAQEQVAPSMTATNVKQAVEAADKIGACSRLVLPLFCDVFDLQAILCWCALPTLWAVSARASRRTRKHSCHWFVTCSRFECVLKAAAG